MQTTKLKWLLVALLSAVPVFGQTPATVTGTVTDAGNNLATSGYVQFDVQPHSNSIQYYIPSVTTINPTTQCGINGSGQVLNFALSGPCLVWGNDNISPGNTNYKVTFAPNGNVTSVVQNELIVGSAYNLNLPQFRPLIQLTPQQNTIITNPFQTNILPTANATFNIGSPTLQYGALYVSNLFLNGSAFSTANIAFLNAANFFTNANAFAGTTTFNGLSNFNNTATFNNATFNASINITAGGNILGTFTGSPTYSGNPIFSGQPSFTHSPAFSISSNTVIPNLNASLLGGFAAPASNIVGISDSQTLTNKIFNIGLNTLLNTSNTAGHYPRNNGTQYVDNTIQSADLPATTSNCTGGQFSTGLNAGGTPICGSISGASSSSQISAATNFGTNLTAQTIVASMPATGPVWVNILPIQTLNGASCSASANTVFATISLTDGNSNTLTQAGSTVSITGNGSTTGGVGIAAGIFLIGTVGELWAYVVNAKVGTAITYTTTSTVGSAGCSPLPQYTVYAKAIY